MPTWKHTLDLSAHWEKANEDFAAVQALASAASAGLLAIPDLPEDDPLGNNYLNEEKQEIADDFRDLSTTEDVILIDEFDAVMTRLYDWGDTKLSGQFFDAVKLCWIKTVF